MISVLRAGDAAERQDAMLRHNALVSKQEKKVERFDAGLALVHQYLRRVLLKSPEVAASMRLKYPGLQYDDLVDGDDTKALWRAMQIASLAGNWESSLNALTDKIPSETALIPTRERRPALDFINTVFLDCQKIRMLRHMIEGEEQGAPPPQLESAVPENVARPYLRVYLNTFQRLFADIHLEFFDEDAPPMPCYPLILRLNDRLGKYERQPDVARALDPSRRREVSGEANVRAVAADSRSISPNSDDDQPSPPQRYRTSLPPPMRVGFRLAPTIPTEPIFVMSSTT
jgi:hypothetical protein